MTTPDDTDASVPPEEIVHLLIELPRTVRTPDLVITHREAVLFLGMSAVEYWRRPCDDTHCEVCYEFVDSWKSLYQSLDAIDRAAVEGYLEAADTRPPAHPQSLR